MAATIDAERMFRECAEMAALPKEVVLGLKSV